MPLADFYLKIKTNLMILKNLKNQQDLEITGNFSTPRLLIGDFYNAMFQLNALLNQHGFLQGIKQLFECKHRIHWIKMKEDCVLWKNEFCRKWHMLVSKAS
ncbi:hypothetical protein Xets_01668 [Xenorhabdus sp. TS4]|nr:hypothetical protein [Xenorhabdus sp. TS4]